MRSVQEYWADRDYGPRRFGRWPCYCLDLVSRGGPTFLKMPVYHWNDGDIIECPSCHAKNPDR